MRVHGPGVYIDVASQTMNVASCIFRSTNAKIDSVRFKNSVRRGPPPKPFDYFSISHLGMTGSVAAPSGDCIFLIVGVFFRKKTWIL